MLYEAHRGVSTAYPENTLASFRAASEMGYDMVELDPAYTSDGVICVLHDRTLNRTCRFPDGSPVREENLAIASLPFDEVRKFDAGLWKGEEFKGEKIPALEEVLAFSRESGTPLKLDNKIFSFPAEMREGIYRPVENSGLAPSSVGFTLATVDAAKEIAARFPENPIHYDGPVTEEALAAIASAAPQNPITVWLPLQTPLTTWVKVAFASKELAELVHSMGAALGIWILHNEEELEEAKRLGADIIETTGGVKPHN